MKKIIKFLVCMSLFITAITFTSCQDEFESVSETNEQETITANSATAKLVAQTVSNDGSFDNIVDGASCFAVKFPYTVTIKGLDVTINSIEDLKLIEEIFDKIDNDADTLEFIFPITVTLADFTEIVINAKEDLVEIAKDCKEGGEDDDIECIDFVYPIKLFTFNVNLEETGNVTVTNDMQLSNFFTSLDTNDIVSLDFPVELALYDGTKITVNTNTELASTLEKAKNTCDEDDDNDYNDDDYTQKDLELYLIECPLLLNEIIRDNQSKIDQYSGYLMSFTENGEVSVKDAQGNVIVGAWSTKNIGSRVVLKLEFDELEDFNLEWFVSELAQGEIKLSVNDDNKIDLRMACHDLPNDAEVSEKLNQCKWGITDATGAFFEDLKIDFSNNNIHAYDPDGATIVDEGVWSLQSGTLMLDNLTEKLVNFNGIWAVIESLDDKITLQRGQEVISLDKYCEANICTDEIIIEKIEQSKWKVGNLEGSFFEDLKLEFINNDINVYSPNDNIVDEGNWSLQEGILYLSGLNKSIPNYTGEWNVIACEDGTFKLERGQNIMILNEVFNQ